MCENPSSCTARICVLHVSYTTVRKENKELAIVDLKQTKHLSKQGIDTSLILFLSITSVWNSGEIAAVISTFVKALHPFENIIKSHARDKGEGGENDWMQKKETEFAAHSNSWFQFILKI